MMIKDFTYLIKLNQMHIKQVLGKYTKKNCYILKQRNQI